MGELPAVLDVRPGRLLARGREATVHEAGSGLVLRRYDDARDVTLEVTVMQHVARHGVRVPTVHGDCRGSPSRPSGSPATSSCTSTCTRRTCCSPPTDRC